MSAVNFSLSHTYMYSIDTKSLYSRKDGYIKSQVSGEGKIDIPMNLSGA